MGVQNFPHLTRYHQVLLRARFDENKNVKDMVQAKQLLLAGEAELESQAHPQPFKYPSSPGGTAYEQDPPPHDRILDTWHPTERAMFPDYFTKREQRKREYIEQWEAKYGKPEPDHHGH